MIGSEVACVELNGVPLNDYITRLTDDLHPLEEFALPLELNGGEGKIATRHLEGLRVGLVAHESHSERVATTGYVLEEEGAILATHCSCLELTIRLKETDASPKKGFILLV